MAEEGESVKLYIYDLTQGLARAMSPMLLGRQIDGVWHTAIVVGNVEYFCGQGVHRAVPGRTPFGTPLSILDLGTTQITADMRDILLEELSTRFKPSF